MHELDLTFISHLKTSPLPSPKGTMAEWSKAADSSPATERCMGSNPIGTIFRDFTLKFINKEISHYRFA